MSASQKKTVLYARLSQADERVDESNSIHNQKIFLETYAADHGYENTVFMADDGYSGTNFNRPSWVKIHEMMEDDQVETLIVKDLSRLGRNHVITDWYTEMYFPEKGIRFLAPGDNVDSDVEESGDFSPIRNWFNELHAKDTSKKVRNVKHQQAAQGERTGGVAPYGYQKRNAHSKDLIPDEVTAPSVQRIFTLCAGGKGPNQIARILTEEHILTPSHYYFQKNGTGHPQTEDPYEWSSGTVQKILENKVYLGHTHSHKRTTVSFKNKKVINVPEDKQTLVEGTHEALITQEVWDMVRSVRPHKRRAPKVEKEPDMFSGLVYCPDCGKPMTVCRPNDKEDFLKCSSYGKKGKAACTPHRMLKSTLEAVVLDDLRRVTSVARNNEKQFADYIHKKDSKQLQKDIAALQKEIAKMQRRIGELSKFFKQLFESKALGEITSEQFKELSADYTEERKQLEAALPEKEERLEHLQESASNVGAFIEKAKRFTNLEILTPEILRLFIDRIEVGERLERYAHNSPQPVRIVYRDVGIIDDSSVEEPTQTEKKHPKQTKRQTAKAARPLIEVRL